MLTKGSRVFTGEFTGVIIDGPIGGEWKVKLDDDHNLPMWYPEAGLVPAEQIPVNQGGDRMGTWSDL